METKDLFSGHAQIYAAYRPTYPEALYEFLLPIVNTKRSAWDCATGNGQVAQRLASDFENVYATDISDKQLQEAFKAPNTFYSISSAEKTSFPTGYFDLITVGQALHWFNTTDFYKEAIRVGKPGCIIAVWGYGNILINEEIDPLLQEFYSNVVGKYWDAARRHVETGYKNIPFPFEVIPSPDFFIEQNWSFQHLKGYLESWSATQKFILDQKFNPVHSFMNSIRELWGDEEIMKIRFPVFMKVGRM
jgi:ubiquinone/menaquinone biosynthesis C-methylase UbiE